ncbi:MAG: GNAT family N-acetyltransferase [Anaerolineae bacterium]
MDIRPAQARDLDACLALDPSYETEYVWQMETNRIPGVISVGFRVTRLPRLMRVTVAPEREILTDHFEQGECFLVAEENGVIRGFLDLSVEPWKRVGWIHQMTVAPERRRRGIASALVHAAMDWAREQSLTTLMIEMPTKNHPAAALLQKHGFTFCGFNDRYYVSRDIAIFFAANVR